jgi:hypothetical protein
MVVIAASGNKELYESNEFEDALVSCRQSSDSGVIGAKTSKPQKGDSIWLP